MALALRGFRGLGQGSKVPMDVLAAQQESFKWVRNATGIIDHHGTPNVTDKSGDLFVAGVPDHLS
eukprot:12888280-Prorocentrum_lima.AAC.1